MAVCLMEISPGQICRSAEMAWRRAYGVYTLEEAMASSGSLTKSRPSEPLFLCWGAWGFLAVVPLELALVLAVVALVVRVVVSLARLGVVAAWA